MKKRLFLICLLQKRLERLNKKTLALVDSSFVGVNLSPLQYRSRLYAKLVKKAMVTYLIKVLEIPRNGLSIIGMFKSIGSLSLDTQSIRSIK